MAKKVTGYVKLQIPAGKATPAPPVGPALGQAGVNIMDFCKTFNARTQAQDGLIKAAGIPKGSGVPHRTKVGKVSKQQVEEIAKSKLPDLNAGSIEAAVRIIEGTARSMGIEVQG